MWTVTEIIPGYRGLMYPLVLFYDGTVTAHRL